MDTTPNAATRNNHLGATPQKRVQALIVQLRASRTAAGRRTIAADGIMPILISTPALTVQRYKAANDKATPLRHFLLAGIEDVAIIEQVIAISPNNLDLKLNLPVACEHSSGAVIEFFLTKLTPAVTDSGSMGYPLMMAMRNTKLTGVMKANLYRLCPNAIACNVLEYALQNDFPLEFFTIVCGLWNSNNYSVLTLDGMKDTVLDLDKCQVICTILPLFDTLNLGSLGWTMDAAIHFLQELRRNKTIQRVTGLQLPSLETSNESQQQDLLQQFGLLLQDNSTLQDIIDSATQENNDYKYTQMWLQCMQQNNTLRSMNFYIGHSIRLRRNRYYLGGAMCLYMDPPRTGEDLSANILQLRSLTHVQDILLYDSKNNWTDNQISLVHRSFAELLRQRHSFRRLVLGVGTNYKGVSETDHYLEVLKNNVWLSALDSDKNVEWTQPQADRLVDLLKHHNTTLTSIVPFQSRDVRIQYYLDLNRLGRRQNARDATSGNTIVDLILSVQEDEELSVCANKCQSVLFGLLQESLSIWGSAVPVTEQTRKRKLAGSELS